MTAKQPGDMCDYERHPPGMSGLRPRGNSSATVPERATSTADGVMRVFTVYLQCSNQCHAQAANQSEAVAPLIY